MNLIRGHPLANPLPNETIGQAIASLQNIASLIDRHQVDAGDVDALLDRIGAQASEIRTQLERLPGAALMR